VRYWRDKRGHEVDFVIAGRGRAPVAIECKASSANFDAGNLAVFRRTHPEGVNFAVTPDVAKPFVERHAGLRVEFVNLEGLVQRLRKQG
jgi:predicted AAA+ superfamily ATPase